MNYEIIKREQIPTTLRWGYVPLYKTDKRGLKRYWQVFFNPDIQELIIYTGVVIKSDGTPGKIKNPTRKKIKENRSGRNIQEQALLEARKKYDIYYDKNYRPEGEEGSKYLEPMLANDYHPPGWRNPNSGIVEESKITRSHLERGISCQPKIDGIRSRSWLDSSGHNIIMMSRTNKRQERHEHIKAQLIIFFKYLYDAINKSPYMNKIINEGYIESKYNTFGIDGELYNHNLTFNEISSIVRTTNKVHEKAYMIQYYIFDFIVEYVHTEERVRILNEAYNNYTNENNFPVQYLILVTSTTANTYEYIEQLYQYYLQMKYEGLIIRKMAGNKILNNDEIKETYYEPGRSNNLLKYKPVITEEGIVLDIISGEGKEEGLAILIIRDIRGNIFQIHPAGSYEVRKKWLNNKYNYIGLPYTFKYNELSEYNVPRAPTGIAFRNYE